MKGDLTIKTGNGMTEVFMIKVYKGKFLTGISKDNQQTSEP